MKTIPLIVSSFLTGRSYCSLLLLIYLTLCTTNCCPFSLKGSLLSPVNRKSFQISNRHTTLQSGLNNMPASTKFTLKQFLNVPGLKALGLIFTDPVKVVPTIHVPTLQSLDLDRLKAQGIECIVFDKDNTLTYCYAEEIHPSVVPVVEKARRLFPNGIAILSNSAGSCDDVDFNMAKFTEEKLSIPVIRHEEKKPGCLDEVIVHFEEKLQKKIQPQQICVIGKFIHPLYLCPLLLLFI